MLQANSISFFAFSSERYLLGSWTLKNFKAPSKSVNSKSSLEVLMKENTIGYRKSEERKKTQSDTDL